MDDAGCRKGGAGCDQNAPYSITAIVIRAFDAPARPSPGPSLCPELRPQEPEPDQPIGASAPARQPRPASSIAIMGVRVSACLRICFLLYFALLRCTGGARTRPGRSSAPALSYLWYFISRPHFRAQSILYGLARTRDAAVSKAHGGWLVRAVRLAFSSFQSTVCDGDGPSFSPVSPTVQ